jgi:hypothetical protein
MRNRALMAMVAVMRLQAGQAERKEQKTIVVYFENSLAPKEQFASQKVAEQMLATAGVRIEWRVGTPSEAKIAEERPIVIRFATNTPPSNHPGALAFAVPYEGVHIKIFYDRVRLGNPRATQAVLAHVLVHEITHILQGIVRHSGSGIMKARWTAQDYTDMAWQPLSFTADDIDLIHTGLVTRTGGGR